MIYNILDEEFAMRIMNLDENKLQQNENKICENIYQQYQIFNYIRIINSKIKSIDNFLYFGAIFIRKNTIRV